MIRAVSKNHWRKWIGRWNTSGLVPAGKTSKKPLSTLGAATLQNAAFKPRQYIVLCNRWYRHPCCGWTTSTTVVLNRCVPAIYNQSAHRSIWRSTNTGHWENCKIAEATEKFINSQPKQTQTEILPYVWSPFRIDPFSSYYRGLPAAPHLRVRASTEPVLKSSTAAGCN